MSSDHERDRDWSPSWSRLALLFPNPDNVPRPGPRPRRVTVLVAVGIIIPKSQSCPPTRPETATGHDSGLGRHYYSRIPIMSPDQIRDRDWSRSWSRSALLFPNLNNVLRPGPRPRLVTVLVSVGEGGRGVLGAALATEAAEEKAVEEAVEYRVEAVEHWALRRIRRSRSIEYGVGDGYPLV